jgi:osmotically-inducible protein OsmY
MAFSAEEIKKGIVDQLFWDTRVDASNVKVDVSGSKVRLSGTVPTYTARRAAEMDALIVPGVGLVENDVTIEYPTDVPLPTDDQVKDNVERLLSLNPDIRSADVDVSVDAGVVTLKGTVDMYWKKERAEDLASDIMGVVKVDNELAIAPTGNYVDKSIAEDIISALDRNANVDASSIDVIVEDGKVVLSGTVPSWVAFRTALDTARYTLGVIDIVNRLRVA